jgi:hypothetical protein
MIGMNQGEGNWRSVTILTSGGVYAVSVVAFAYDTYTNPSNDNGVLGGTVTPILLILS